MKKVLLTIGLIFGISLNVFTQVTGVKYLIEYNDNSSLYDCKIVISKGKAHLYSESIQLSSQFTVVVPTGSEVILEEFHNPLLDNHLNNGTEPCIWKWGKPALISPQSQPQNDFYAVIPQLAPTASYDNLYEGDTITLFSLLIDVDPCENLVRPFENGVDLQIPVGWNFDNHFKIGSSEHIYDNNLSSEYEESYYFFEDSVIICEDECINLSPILLCAQEGLKFEWSTGETTEEIEVCPEVATNYYILVKDSNDYLLDSLVTFIGFDQIEIEDIEICVNEYTFISANIPGGLWDVSSTEIATIDPNTGIIFGESPGEITVTYSSPSGCLITSNTLQVLPTPEIILDGSGIICAGETISVTTNTTGIWMSSDTSIATISEDGIVEGFESGIVTITQSADNGCSSEPIDIRILKPPTGEISGPDTICPGGTTQLPYVSGGTWRQSYASESFVATIDNFGNVTGIFEGKVVYEYADFWGECDTVYSDTIYVVTGPTVSFIGDDRLCIGETSSVSSNTGGTWESTHPSVASIDPNSGEIIGLAQGITKFTFTDSSTGCTAYTSGLIVDPVPSVSVYLDSICINSTTEVVPSIGGVWSSLTPEIATVDGNIVRGISFGDAVLTYTSDATGCTSHPLNISVGTSQTSFLTGPDHICIGATTSIEPSGAGLWSSSDDAIATMDEDGNIIGLEAGEVTFTYVGVDPICVNNPTQSITVNELPVISASATEMCMYESISLSSNNGKWESNNPEVASVSTYTGTVYPKEPGIVTFTFTSNATGCMATTDPITVHPLAFELDSPFEMCWGETANLSIDVTGTWESKDPYVATVDMNSGLITAVSEGYARITFTDETTNCISELEVMVNPLPHINYGGTLDLCVGDMSTFTTTYAGTWVSNYPSVASINNSGLVTALNPGFVTFTFTSSDDGCSRETGEFFVLQPSDPACLVGIEEVEESKIKLYPNPASENVYVESESSIESVSMYTIDYRKVNVSLLSEGSNRVQIVTNDLTQGIYYVAIESEGKIIYKKIIIE